MTTTDGLLTSGSPIVSGLKHGGGNRGIHRLRQAAVALLAFAAVLASGSAFAGPNPLLIPLPIATAAAGAISVVGQEDSFTFTGTIGQRLYYDTLDVTPQNLLVQILAPSGASVGFYYNATQSEPAPFYLQESGLYTLKIFGNGDATGTYNFRLLDCGTVPALTIPSTNTVVLNPSAATEVYRLNAVAGQRIVLTSLSNSTTTASWSLVDPANQVLNSASIGTDLGTNQLQINGIYLIVVAGSEAGQPAVTFRFQIAEASDAPVSPSGLGTVQTGLVDTGTTNTLSYTINAGTEVFFDSQVAPGSVGANVQLVDPDGNAVFYSDASYDSGPHFCPRSGTYQLQTVGSSGGSYRFRLLDLPTDSIPLVFGATNTAVLSQGYHTDIYRFDGTPGQRLYYDSLLAANPGDVTWSLTTRGHGNLSSSYWSSSDCGLFFLPQVGTYYLIQSSQVGDPAAYYSFRLLDTALAPVTPLSLNTFITNTLAPGTKVVLYTFSGTAGQRLYFDSLGTNAVGTWQLFDPQNGSQEYASINTDFTLALPQTGTYVLALNSGALAPIQYAFRVITAATTTFPFTLGANTTGTIATVGEEHHYTFTGNAGQRLFFDALSSGYANIALRLLGPDGNVVGLNGDVASEMNPFTLTATGPYTLVIGGLVDTLGSYGFNLIDAGQPPTIPVTYNTPYSGSNAPYQAAVFSVSGLAGQRLVFKSLAADNATWTLYTARNEMLASAYVGSDFEVLLSETGTNLLVLDSVSGSPFGYSFQVISPLTITNALALGTTVSNMFAGPGDVHRYSFNGVAGQRLYYDGLDLGTTSSSVILLAPNGETMTSANSADDFGLIILLTPGVYTLEQHNGMDYGTSYEFRLLDLASQASISTGIALSDQLSPVSQSRLYRVPLSAGQKIRLQSISASPTTANWYVINPFNSPIQANNIAYDLDDVLAPVTGIYAILIRGTGTGSGTLNYQFRLTPINDPLVSISGLGTFTGTVAPSATNFIYFSAPAGLPIYIDSLTNNNAVYLSLFDTNGQSVTFQNNSASAGYPDPGMFILPSSGIYTLQIVGSPGGEYALRILNLAGDSIPLGCGTNCAGAIGLPFQTVAYSFSGALGQRLLCDGLEGDGDPVYVQMLAPDGSPVPGYAYNYYYYYGNADGDYGPATLQESGTYYLLIQSGVANPSHYAFRLLDLNQAPTLFTSLGATNGTGLMPASAVYLSLTGTYFNGSLDGGDESDWRTSQTIAGSRVDAAVNFMPDTWGSRADVGITDGSDTNWLNFSVQWDGTILISNPNTRLYVTNYGGCRFWIDLNQDSVFEPSELFSNSWGGGYWSAALSTASPPLQPGVYNIRIQYAAGYAAAMSLLWDNGYNIGPYEALAFRFYSDPGPLFFDSFEPAQANWMHFQPERDYPAGLAGGLGIFESVADQAGMNLVVLYNNSALGQPYHFSVLMPPSRTNSLTLGATYVSTLGPGENQYYLFNGSSGQRLYYDALSPHDGSIGITLMSPSGATLSSTVHYQDAGPLTLTEEGTYVLVAHNYLDAPTDWNFRLLDVGAQPLISFDETNSFSVGLGTTASLFQFNSLAHLRIFVDDLASTARSGYWYVYGPNNESLAVNAIYYNGGLSIDDPALTATYLLVVNSGDTNGYSFSFRVVPGNHPPALALIANRTINELVRFSFTNSVSDVEADNAQFTFSLDPGAPAGASLDPITGVFSWTPTEAQGPGTNLVTMRVTDDGIPPMSDAKSFTLTVNEVNSPPVLNTVTNRTIDELTLLTVTNLASDSDVPANTLGYALLNPPGGASISPNGVITWTPAQTQSPSTNTITTVVTDTNMFDLLNPHLSGTNTFTVVVREVNVAPVLPGIVDKTINELTLLTVTNTATESNIHSTLGYMLVNPPVGAGIDANGIVTWTPAQTQSPSTNLITTIVTNTNPYDVVNPHLSATNTFTVVVREVNVAPVLPGIADRTIHELTLLAVTNTATESNIHSTLGYMLVNPPLGAAIDANGVFTWTPVQTQSPSTNLITTIVTNTNPYDLVNPHLSATNAFAVIVREVNVAPVLPAIPTQIVSALSTLSVINAATDPNIHSTLSYALLNPPLGVNIDASGVITWTPTLAQYPGTNTITTVATSTDLYDLVNPTLTSTNSFTVIVAPEFRITSIAVSNQIAVVTWNAIADHTYRLQYRDSLDTTNWQDLLPDITATSGTASATNALGNAGQRFYRVMLVQLVPPTILSLHLTGDVASIAWSSVAGQTYRLQYEDSANSASWTEVPLDIPATSSTTTTTNAVGGAGARFYRIRVVP
jgi:hypothetical protein